MVLPTPHPWNCIMPMQGISGIMYFLFDQLREVKLQEPIGDVLLYNAYTQFRDDHSHYTVVLQR